MWLNIIGHIAKGQRYTIGNRIENKFLDLLEVSYIAYFTPKERKVAKLSDCILLLDTLKFLIHTTWEARIISHKQYAEIAEKLEEVGRMLGGWKKRLENPDKKNHAL
ncbi:MAG: four helix bundle protein [bacterium]